MHNVSQTGMPLDSGNGIAVLEMVNGTQSRDRHSSGDHALAGKRLDH